MSDMSDKERWEFLAKSSYGTWLGNPLEPSANWKYLLGIISCLSDAQEIMPHNIKQADDRLNAAKLMLSRLIDESKITL